MTWKNYRGWICLINGEVICVVRYIWFQYVKLVMILIITGTICRHWDIPCKWKVDNLGEWQINVLLDIRQVFGPLDSVTAEWKLEILRRVSNPHFAISAYLSMRRILNICCRLIIISCPIIIWLMRNIQTGWGVSIYCDCIQTIKHRRCILIETNDCRALSISPALYISHRN